MQALGYQLPITAAGCQWLTEAINDAALLVGKDSHPYLFPIKEHLADTAAVIELVNPRMLLLHCGSTPSKL